MRKRVYCIDPKYIERIDNGTLNRECIICCRFCLKKRICLSNDNTCKMIWKKHCKHLVELDRLTLSIL